MTNEERKQIAYEIAYDAMDLYEEGWRASDREALKERYDLTDWEADVMVEALEKLASQASQAAQYDEGIADYKEKRSMNEILRVRWKQVQAAKKIIDKSCFRWYEETDKALPYALTGNKLDRRLFLAAIKGRREGQRAYWEEVWKVMENWIN